MPVRSWKYRALASAFSSNVPKLSSDSSTDVSGIPAPARSTASTSKSARISLSSRSFPLLRVASSIGSRSAAKSSLLGAIELLDSGNRKREEVVELPAIERAMLAGALHFHELSL